MKLLHPFRYGIIYLAVHLPNTKRRMQAVELSVKSQVKSQHSTRETLNPGASNISGADSVQLAVATFHWTHCVFSIRPVWALYVEGEKDLTWCYVHNSSLKKKKNALKAFALWSHCCSVFNGSFKLQSYFQSFYRQADDMASIFTAAMKPKLYLSTRVHKVFPFVHWGERLFSFYSF